MFVYCNGSVCCKAAQATDTYVKGHREYLCRTCFFLPSS